MNYKKLKKCRLCNSDRLKIFIDFHTLVIDFEEPSEYAESSDESDSSSSA
jgi:hypothetical protein